MNRDREKPKRSLPARALVVFVAALLLTVGFSPVQAQTGSHPVSYEPNPGELMVDYQATDCPISSYSTTDVMSIGQPWFPSPLVNDAWPAPQSIRNQRQSEMHALGTGSNAPGYLDTSVFMNGRVVVGIILPESTGNAENWTDAIKNCVVQKIQTGMDWWKAHASAASGLDFVYDLQLGVSTTYEPIQQTSSNAGAWIQNVMGTMGYSQTNYQDRVYAYVNHIRTQYSAKWAYAIFVANATNDADGKFADGTYFAWAQLGGPYIVMTSKNDGWGLGNMNWVAAHETGHIFLAADQYYQAGYGGCTSTTDRYGYLGVPNSNCEYNNPNSVPSIMRSNENALDASAAGQIGWRDANTNAIPDTIDTTPGFNLTAINPNPTSQSRLTYNGQVFDNPWPHANCGFFENCYDRDITINTISGVQYQVDGGNWINISASDGGFNSDFEAISFTTDNLNNGTHTIQVQATNSVGHSNTWSDTVTVNSPYTLTVSKAGDGGGSITSSPAGIDCGSRCSANFDPNASVTLTAASDGSSAFSGWSGEGCAGIGTCSVVVSATRSVSASYVLNPICFGMALTPSTGGTISVNPRPNCKSSTQYSDGAVVSLEAVPDSHYYRFISWGGDLTGNLNPQDISITATRTVSASFEKSTFGDVPFDYSETLGGTSYLLYPYIQSLWNGGFTAGCVADPLTYCPALQMDRAMSSVFMLRGNFGRDYQPPPPPYTVFTADDWTKGPWAQPFAEGMWKEGLTAGCQQPADNPQKLFCPWDVFTRAQGAVFGLRLKYGMNYGTPANPVPDATGLVFADMTDTLLYPTAFAEKAYADGLLPACGTIGGKPLFCPDMAVDRAWAAYLVVKSKGMVLP